MQSVLTEAASFIQTMLDRGRLDSLEEEQARHLLCNIAKARAEDTNRLIGKCPKHPALCSNKHIENEAVICDLLNDKCAYDPVHYLFAPDD